MTEPTVESIKRQYSDAIAIIAQLTKERDEARRERDCYDTQINAWYETFGTSQLTHASSLLDCAIRERDNLAAQLKEQSSHIRCIYCNAKYTAEQSGELADHILSCKKSPLVQMVKEMDSRIIDRMDMVSDEFERILAITDNQEVIGICERAQQVIEQKEPVIKQRDDALDKLRLSESQVVQLLDENNSLKLDYSHSEAENAQLAARLATAEAKCVQLEMRCALWGGVFQKYESFLANGAKTVKTADVIKDYRYCEQENAIKGWLSPEKKKVLVEALETIDSFVSWRMSPDGEMNHIVDNRTMKAIREAAKQALEETAQ